MISVIIPCFNAANFIEETIESITSQNIDDLEIIIIDDGSTDNSGQVINSIEDSRIIYKYQKNLGVSAARNNGLRFSKGEYVVFFDADDKMSNDFLIQRKMVLDENFDLGFCCGPVVSFPSPSKDVFGIADNIIYGLLTYQSQYSSCPSNYLFRKSVLNRNNIWFNEKLSSTADRFFLIELAHKTSGKLIHVAPLLYRVSPNSMSNKLNQKLVSDNELFYHELLRKDLIPESIKKEFFFRIQYILGFGFLRTGKYIKGLMYVRSSFFLNFKKFFAQFFFKNPWLIGSNLDPFTSIILNFNKMFFFRMSVLYIIN